MINKGRLERKGTWRRKKRMGDQRKGQRRGERAWLHYKNAWSTPCMLTIDFYNNVYKSRQYVIYDGLIVFCITVTQYNHHHECVCVYVDMCQCIDRHLCTLPCTHTHTHDASQTQHQQCFSTSTIRACTGSNVFTAAAKAVVYPPLCKSTHGNTPT